MAPEPSFFATVADFRRWLEANHDQAAELLVGFHKKATGRPSIDWPQARDQALCFGWIDGIRKSIDEESYTVRFTPRRVGSVWSRVNIGRFAALKAEGQMTEAGERAFAAGREDKSHYSYESKARELSREEMGLFSENEAAWADWETRPPGYRKLVLHWVTSARKPETRARRLAILIEDSAAGRKITGVDISRKKSGG
jgi:uncharacterized protein YdeI (YjbR/CyaY-like superfamily)